MKTTLMKTTLLFLVVALAGCSTLAAGPPDVIQLTPQEKQEAIAIANQRQQLAMDRERADNEFTRRSMDIDLQANKLCFEIKREHAIPPNAQYTMDEYRGQLRRQSYTFQFDGDDDHNQDARALHSTALRGRHALLH